MGGKPGDYPQTVVEWLRDFVNVNELQIIGVQFVPTSGQTVDRGCTDLTDAVKITERTFSFQGVQYTMVIYWVPAGSFWDDPGVQAILANGFLLGMSDNQIGYLLYLYSNGLRPDSPSEFPIWQPLINIRY
jgi:hypothetical protein